MWFLFSSGLSLSELVCMQSFPFAVFCVAVVYLLCVVDSDKKKVSLCNNDQC